MEHGELLKKERALAEREEEIKGWKDRRIEEGLAEIRVSQAAEAWGWGC